MNPDRMNLLEDWLREDDSAAAFFRAIQPAMPESLVSESNYARILEVASRVPGVCALNGFYFEFVLGESEARADISFRAPAAHGCPGALAARQLGGPWRRDDPWFTLQRLASKWSQPGKPLQEKVAVLWLEFDINGTQPYSPSLFLTPQVLHRQSRAQHLEECRSLFATLWQELGEAIPPASHTAALSCLEHLPEKAWLGQVGCMVSRSPGFLRLCLQLQRGDILEYLRDLGAPADLPRVADILDLFGSYDHEFFLHLDVLEEVQPKVGLDLMLPPAKNFYEARLGKILEELCRLKLCTPAKRDALQNLSGYTAMGVNLINWPPALRRRCLQSQFSEISYFIRTISHLKVVIEPGHDLVAKAYVGVNHHWNKTTLPERNGSHGPNA
jgi:hypothetical protein